MMRPGMSNPWQAIDGGKLRNPWLMAIDFGCSQPVHKARAFMRRTGTPVSLLISMGNFSYMRTQETVTIWHYASCLRSDNNHS